MIEGRETAPETFRLNYGMVGGGPGAFIGDVHRKAIAMDGKAQLSAGCFSQDYEKTLMTGAGLGLERERLYATFEDMFESEKNRGDKIDFVVIAAPNNTHFAMAKLALECGIHVVCDKPLTTNSREAEELGRMAAEKDLLFCVTYAYTGYPIVKHMREMIAGGDLGDIRFVNAEYPQDWLATLKEKRDRSSLSGGQILNRQVCPTASGILEVTSKIWLPTLPGSRSKPSVPVWTHSVKVGSSMTTPPL